VALSSDTFRRIRGSLDSMRVFDVHSHLGGGGHRQARTLADIVSYHWLAVELSRAAGRKFQADPSNDPERYISEVLPFFPAIANTSNHFALVGLLRDLYGFRGRTLDESNWREVDARVRAHAADGSWLGEVLDRARVERVLVASRDGLPDGSGRFVPYEYAEYLYAPLPRRPRPDAARPERPPREKPGRLIGEGDKFPSTPEELEALIGTRVDSAAAQCGSRALHVWLGWDWRYSSPDAGRVAAVLPRLARASEESPEAVAREAEGLSPDERRLLTSFCADAVANAAGRRGMVIQLFHGMTPYAPGSPGNVSTWDPEFLRGLGPHFSAHRDARFDLFLGTRIPGHEAASMSRVHWNLMVSGAWWHAFTPSTMVSFFRDRLEMLPANAWSAFYSDGYIVEWIYGKLLVTKQCLALALAGMVDEGFLAESDALEIAPRLLYDNAAAAYRA